MTLYAMHSHSHCHCIRHMDILIEQNQALGCHPRRTYLLHQLELMDSLIDPNILRNAFD